MKVILGTRKVLESKAETQALRKTKGSFTSAAHE